MTHTVPGLNTIQLGFCTWAVHLCTAALSGAVQTWKWAYIHSHPGYCYCVHKSSQSVSFPIHCPWSRSRISLLTTSTRQSWRPLRKRHVRFHKSKSELSTILGITWTASQMNCSDFCVAESRFLCGIYLECDTKDDFNFTPSLLCDKHKHSLIFVTQFIISIQ